jgi:hypothetical protein
MPFALSLLQYQCDKNAKFFEEGAIVLLIEGGNIIDQLRSADIFIFCRELRGGEENVMDF